MRPCAQPCLGSPKASPRPSPLQPHPGPCTLTPVAGCPPSHRHISDADRIAPTPLERLCGQFRTRHTLCGHNHFTPCHLITCCPRHHPRRGPVVIRVKGLLSTVSRVCCQPQRGAAGTCSCVRRTTTGGGDPSTAAAPPPSTSSFTPSSSSTTTSPPCTASACSCTSPTCSWSSSRPTSASAQSASCRPSRSSAPSSPPSRQTDQPDACLHHGTHSTVADAWRRAWARHGCCEATLPRTWEGQGIHL